MSSKQIEVRDAKCTGLSLLAPIMLAKEDADGNSFLIEAYTGETVERWWGMLSISLDGIKSKKQIPILMGHDQSKIVGHSSKTYNDGSFFVAGKYSGVTDAAKEVKALAAEGFPWQASIGVRPLKIMSLEKGVKEKVNDKTLTGPAEIWLESEVFETSFVPLGADDNTSVSTFSKFEEAQPSANLKPHNKEEIMEFTLENLTKDAPALLAEIQAKAKAEGLTEGEKLESGRIIEIAKEHFGESGEKFEALINSGVTLAQYQAMKDLQPDQTSEEDLKAKILAELENDKVGDPGSGEEESKSPKTFMEAWKEIKAEENLTTQKAMSKAAKLFPELYAKHSKGGK